MVLLLALVVLLSLRLRRGEMETLFKIGCGRWMTFGMQAAENHHSGDRGCCDRRILTWLVIDKFGVSGGHVVEAGATNQTSGREAARGGGQLSAVVFYQTNLPEIGRNCLSDSPQ